MSGLKRTDRFNNDSVAQVVDRGQVVKLLDISTKPRPISNGPITSGHKQAASML
jgi:hypothetical protein